MGSYSPLLAGCGESPGFRTEKEGAGLGRSTVSMAERLLASIMKLGLNKSESAFEAHKTPKELLPG